MLKFDRRKKKLVIPVGINPSYNIDSSTLYNISDATANANDIVSGKVAYGSDGKIIGTLVIDNLIEESYNEGVNEQKSKLTTITITENGTYNREDGYNEVVVDVPDINGSYDEGYNEGVNEQKSKLTTITITENGSYSREDGYNEVIVDVPDINGSYDEGYNEGVVVGRNEIINEQSDATITPQTVLKGEIGYGSNNERIVGEYEFVEGFDFGVIGYNQAESNECNNTIYKDIAYSKTLYDAWDPNKTSANSLYRDSNIVYAPNINTSNVTNMEYMFYNCISLTSVPQFDTSKVNSMYYMFYGCSNLTTIPLFNTSNVINMKYMLSDCSNLTSVPQFDTSKVNSMFFMFQNCSNLTSVPLFDTSNVTNMSYMFQNCSSLTSVPLFDTSKVDNITYMFYKCSSLTSVPLFDTSKVTAVQNMFYGCSNLTECPSFNLSNVTNVDGFLNNCSNLVTINELNLQSVNNTGGLGQWNTFNGLSSLENVIGLMNFGQGFKGSSSNGMTLTSSTNLTRESCLNIFNSIYDMNLNTSYTGTPTIQLSTTTKAILSNEDIAIATSKGWTIS